MMCVAAAAMLRGRAPTPLSDNHRASATRLAALGVAVGVVMGLVGAGGGFLLVPALVLFGGLPMPAAVGTSLVVIAMQSLAGLAGHLVGHADRLAVGRSGHRRRGRRRAGRWATYGDG